MNTLNIKTEIFRFFTLRAPEKYNNPKKENGYIAIDKSFLISSLYLADIKNYVEQDEEAENAYAAILERTGSFQNSDAYLGSIEEVVSDYEGYEIEELAKWLNIHGADSSLDEIETRIAFYGIDKENYLLVEETNGLRQKVWENVVSQTIVEKNNNVKDYLFNVLKVGNFLEVLKNDPGSLEKKEKRSRLINSTIILPNAIFPIPIPKDKGDTIPPNPSDEIISNRRELALKWHKYHDALNEVEFLYTCKLDAEKIKGRSFEEDEELDPCSAKNKSSFSNDFSNDFSNGSEKYTYVDFDVIEKSKLTNKTNQVLDEIWCKDTSSFSVFDVIARLQAKLVDISNEMVKLVNVNTKVSLIGGSLIEYDENVETIDVATSSGGKEDICDIKNIGTADLLVVEQRLKCYRPGEVAHIENVLKGEYKDRTTRRLNRKESVFSSETINEVETEKDVQSTDRYEMQQQTSQVVQKDTQMQMGVQVSANLGVAQVSSNLGFSMSNSSTQSNNTAVEYAKNVTERARQRVFERTKEEKKITIIEEFEETNKHGFENRGDNINGHIVGIYRWVDKIYEAQVMNYGLRTMFQFMIPEPAGFHIHSMQSNPIENITIDKPRDPKLGVNLGISGQPKISITKLTNADDINISNYLYWAGIYGAEVETPPLDKINVSKTFHQADLGSKRYAETIDFPIPEGYESNICDATISYENLKRDDSFVITIGKSYSLALPNVFLTTSSFAINERRMVIFQQPILGYSNSLPITIWGYDNNATNLAINITLNCLLTSTALMQWKLKTYKAIMDAYEAKKAKYDGEVAQLKAQAGISVLKSNNPGRNREIEKTELKKGCLQLLRKKKWNTTDFSSVNYNPSQETPYNYPEFDNCKAISEGNEALFLEHAFEWEQVTYVFYPYFWGSKKRWSTVYTLEDNDPIFTAFLQAGTARVIVPVRPGFEEAVAYYNRTGMVWNGGNPPTVDDKDGLWVSIVEEIKNRADIIGAYPVGPTWEIKLPTNLVILQKDAEGIDESGLPCDGNSNLPPVDNVINIEE